MRLIPRLAGVLLALAAGLVHATEIRLGSLALDWPAGYTVKSTQPPFELAGPGGVKVLVTVMRSNAPDAGSPEALAKAQALTERLLTTQARQAGKVVVPLGTEALPDGTRLQFIGAEVSRLFRSGYFLQYALVGGSGQLALLTFEGSGDAAAAHADVRGLFRSVQWNNADAGSSAEQAAFTEKVVALMKAQGLSPLVAAEPLTLKLGELQANLDRVYTFCRANAGGCDAELQRYVKTVGDLARDKATPLAPQALRVVLRTGDYADSAQQSMAAQGGLVQRPLAGGLVALGAVDSPRSVRLLNANDCKTLGLTPEQAYDTALANVRAELADAAVPPVKPGAVGTLEGDYAPSRLLLQADWAPVAQAQGGVLVVAVPARNLVMYGADDSAAGLDALRALVKDTARRAPAPLADVLLRWTPAGWQVVR